MKGDWVTKVEEDLGELELRLTYSEIEQMSKERFKETVTKAVETTDLNGF